VFITHSLSVDSNALNGQQPIFFTQPPAIQLVVWHNPQEQDTQTHCQQTGNEEDDFPGLNRGTRFPAPDSNAVGEAAAEDLGEPVETEPDASARALLFFGVPLRGEEGEAGGYG